jgi:CheY-like chemotaxis protein
VAPETVISEAVRDLFLVHPQARIDLSYRLNHKHAVVIDVRKVARVFSNILGNAIEAMSQNGAIWVRTADRGKLVEFCIGNSGSVIQPALLSRLFGAFVTSGKKGGTGLGLAIAKKVVEGHGGEIWCESGTSGDHPVGKVEFFFTLPAGALLSDERRPPLPIRSQEIVKTALDSAPSAERGEQGSLTDSEVSTAPKAHVPEVLVVDDNPFFLEAWAAALGRSVRSHLVRSGEELERLMAEDPSLIDRLNAAITDMRLDGSAYDGLGIGRKLKAFRKDLPVLLSSDESLADSDLAGSIDRRIAKDPVSYEDLGIGRLVPAPH